MMVLMALVTTIVTTPLLELVAPRSFQRPSLPAPDGAQARPVRLLLCVGDARMGPPMALLAAACAGGSRESGSVALHLERPRDRTSSYLGPASRPGGEERASGLLPAFETAAAAELALEFVSFDSTDPATDICEIARSKRSDYVVLGMHRPMLGRNSLGGTVGAVLDRSRSHVALLIDHGFTRAFARGLRAPAKKRVVAALCGGRQDALVLEFGEQLLKDDAISLSVLCVEPMLSERAALTERITALVVKHAERVALRTEHSTDRHATLLQSAADADLLLLGLDSSWGLGPERLSVEAVRLLADSPASLLVLRAHSA
jgi:hypothetical protein